MTPLVTRLRERIDTLTDERDDARTELARRGPWRRCGWCGKGCYGTGCSEHREVERLWLDHVEGRVA